MKELAGLAPGPFAGMLLADFGADVVRIDRPGQPNYDILCRRKRSIQIDIKYQSSKAVLEKLLRTADVLIDPYRPGVLESLGLDPERLRKRNDKLIVARLTGFRRDGKYKNMAGHDINYLAISGLLSLLGRANEKPYAPGNILADFAGGGLVCALAIILALFNRTSTGKGQVVEVNMVDGVRYLAIFPMLLLQFPDSIWTSERGRNMLDGGAPYYDTYKTKDGQYMAVGAIEPKFYDALLKRLNINPDEIPNREDHGKWSELSELFTQKFMEKTQNEWERIFNGTDTCVTPVLPLSAEDNRPVAMLSASPSLDVSHPTFGILNTGKGATEILKNWLGWSVGRDYIVDTDGTVKIASNAKL